MTLADPKIVLVVALPAEATPMVEAYGLSRKSDRPFIVYAREERVEREEREEIALIVTGVGKVRCAAAMGYLLGILPDRPRAWIQVGVAGHRSHDLGDVFMAHKILDTGTGRVFYPPTMIKRPCPGEVVATVDQVCVDYPQPWLFEMEASGFYEALSLRADPEFFAILKVVSDNAETPVSEETFARIQPAVSKALPCVRAVVGEFLPLVEQERQGHDAPESLSWFEQRWHFSTTGRRRLERLLRRYRALAPDEEVDWNRLENLRDFKQVLGRLEEMVDRLRVEFRRG